MILIKLSLNSTIGVIDMFVGATAGGVITLIPALGLPSGYSLPKDITTLGYQGIGYYCLWICGDGIAKGAFLNFPQKRYLPNVPPPVSWVDDPTTFVVLVMVWMLIGILCASVPVYYFRKAIRDTSQRERLPLNSIPVINKGLRSYRKWAELPENFQASFIFVIVLSSILVFLFFALVVTG